MASPGIQPKTKSRGVLLLQAAALAAATWFVFAPALHGGWLWDDDVEITANPNLGDWAGLQRIWNGSNSPDYFPLKTTAQWVQWHLWGDHVLGYHLTNVGLHLLGALLLWRIFGKLGIRLAWLGGLLFAVHPLVVESVAWISELKNVLSLPLVLMAFGAWIDWDAKRSAGSENQGRDGRPARPGSTIVSDQARTGGPPVPTYILSIGFFLAAMLCKSSVVMFPVVLLLYAWWKRGRIAWADLRASAPFFAISMILGWVTLLFQAQRALAGEVVLTGGLWPRVASAGLALAFYLWKFVAPIGLLPIYPRWAVDPPSPLQFLPWLAAAGAFIWWWQKRKAFGRHLLFGGGFFLLNLLPVLGFVPMSFLRLAWVADHFVYLPLVGLVGLAAAGLSEIPARKTVLFFAAFLLAALAIESRYYAGRFADTRTLWSYTLAGNPDAWAAHNNLGNALVDAGNIPEATVQYEEAVRLKPDYAEARNNLGNLYFRTGRMNDALAQYERALQIFPDYPQALSGLGNLLFQTGHAAEAVAEFERALKTAPRYAEARSNLGNALSGMGRYAEAEEQLRLALQLRPDFPEAHNNLGNICLWTNRSAEAIAEYEEALRLRPDFPEARNNLANALMRSGRSAEAMLQLEQVVRLTPSYAEAHFNLGLILATTGHTQEAIAQFGLALRYRPDFPQARRHLDALLGGR